MLKYKSKIINKIDKNETFSDNAKITLKTRYLKKDNNLKLTETIEDCFNRVAKHIAQAEKDKPSYKKWKNIFYEMMVSKKFLPNTPTIMNSGNERRGCLSACFVLPIEDSLESIFETLKNTVLIFREGGGVGINFSNLRPSGDIIASTTAKGQSTGVLSFMKLYDDMISVVKQGGTRRGAMMGILRVDHPDIINFIRSKRNNGDSIEQRFTNLNISVGITNEFIKCYFNKKRFKLINPRTKKVVKTIDTETIFNELVISNYKCGDPGMVFLDRINATNPFKEQIECVNPCGEQPLLAFESCNLGSINIEMFANNIKIKPHKLYRYEGNLPNHIFNQIINIQELKKTIEHAVRFLDNTITVNKFPLPQIEEKTLNNRKIGLGIMGFANLLYRLKIPYNSQTAIDLAERLMGFINGIAHKYSKDLAIEKGAFKGIKETRLKKLKRNAVITTIAPTGSISIIADTSSGIEPNFLLAYEKNVLGGLRVVNQPLIEYLEEEKYDIDDVINYIIQNNGVLHDYNIRDKTLTNVFKTAHEIDWRTHIKIQESFQKYTDNGISKTINLPNDEPIGTIRKIYETAMKSTILKGITIFRDGCLHKQVLQKLETCPECHEGVLINDGKCKRCDKCGFSNKCAM